VFGLPVEDRVAQLGSLFAGSPVGIVFIGLDRTVVELNTAAAGIVGLEASEVVGRKLDEFLHPDELDETHSFEQQLRSGSEPGSPRYKRFVHRDGSVVHVRVTVLVLRDSTGAPVHVAGFLEDVTAIRAALDRVQEEQVRSALTLDASGMATWDLDLQTGAYVVSDNLYEACGIDALNSDLTFPAFIERVHPEDLPQFLAPADPGNGEDRFSIEFRLRDDAGRYRWCQSQGQVTFVDEQPVRLRGAIIDITARRDREEQQQQQTQLYRRTIEATGDAFIAADLDGRIVGWNPAAECMFGWSHSQVLGEITVDALFAPGTDLSSLTGRGGRTTLTAQNRGGKQFTVEASIIGQPDNDQDDPGFRVFVHDITDRVEHEHALAHHALLDHLTGLPNRTLLLDRLRGALARRARRISAGCPLHRHRWLQGRQ
jgi:PAS domain S-box-containing protein